MAYIGKEPSTGVRTSYSFTATGGETSFSASDTGKEAGGKALQFSDGEYVDVYLNGVKLKHATDYVTTTANTIGSLSALSASDILDVVVYDIFGVADTVSKVDGGTFDSSVIFDSGLDINGQDFVVDADGDTKIFASTDDVMQFSTANTNRMLINNNGCVGILTGSETNFTTYGNNGVGSLVRGFTVQHNSAASYVAEFRSEGNNANRYGLILFYGADDNHSSTATAISFLDGDGTSQGTIASTNGTVSYGAFTANHDVYLPDADKQTGYPYGTLVECVSTTYKKSVGTNTTLERGIRYNVQKTSSKMSKAVMGAYAVKYSTFYEQGDTIPNGKVVGDEKVVDNPLHQVYILGDGHILCNNETGNIEIGDFITASSTAGIGMKATETGITCGIAREAITFSNSSETKLVAVEYGIRQFVAS
tara:strand:- start:110 stop:1372 length:1263 start_codon:yes stop_codon:yes gene_type:complete